MGGCDQNEFHGDWLEACRMDSAGLDYGPVSDSCKYDDELAGSGVKDLVS
jgi:hypothetical protein